MMKLLYLHNSALDSDKAHLTQVVSMCKAFKNCGVNVILGLENPNNIDKTNAYKSLEKQYGRPIDFDLVLNASFPAKYPRFGKYFNVNYYKKIIRHISPDLCFVRAPLMMKSCIQANTRYLYESHNNIMHQRSSLLSKYWSRTLINEASKDRLIKVIAISNNLKKYWIDQGIDESRIIALHDGVQKRMFKTEISQNKARKNLGFPCDIKLVLYSGSLFENREIENIIALAEKITQAKFVIVGGPQENVQYFQKEADNKELKNVIFIGRKPHYQVPQYLFAADVLLGIWSKKVPTINYCSPLKLFEYMAAGRIIVAHGFPTITEVLTDNVHALIAEPGNFDNLLLRVSEAITLTYPNEIAANARREALEKYSWEARAEKILEVCWPSR
jgi:glycosyltransferase involved in cell wall biosynthesis